MRLVRDCLRHKGARNCAQALNLRDCTHLAGDGQLYEVVGSKQNAVR
jgi:hypothetical protein